MKEKNLIQQTKLKIVKILKNNITNFKLSIQLLKTLTQEMEEIDKIVDKKYE